MITPVRLRLSRARGFDLQKLSLRANGLPAVSVARPTIFGNPWRMTAAFDDGYKGSVKQVVSAFRCWMDGDPAYRPAEWTVSREDILSHIHVLRGKNLACWCAYDAPCHADVLLEIANS